LRGERLRAETAFARIALAYGWVWLRATFPRYRYDMLMSLAWKRVLPAALILLLFFLLLCKFT
jgi:NADH-quinone oxidoreductase subunit H